MLNLISGLIFQVILIFFILLNKLHGNKDKNLFITIIKNTGESHRRWERRIVGAIENKIPGEHNTQNLLSRSHRDSQRLKCQLWSLHGSVLSLLQICYSC